MNVIQDTTDRLVLQGGSPLFRPFFVGGLVFVVLGVGLLIGGPLAGRAGIGPPTGTGGVASVVGTGAFLATFGFFVASVPLVGRIPYRKEIIVDRAAGQFIRRDRTLLRLRQESYPLVEVREAAVEEARHVDGDPYFSMVLRLENGEAVTLDRFTDRAAADRTARLIRDHFASDPPTSRTDWMPQR
jgi:hypothetical protein